MARAGHTEVEFNDRFFEEIGKSAGVTKLSRQKAEAVLAAARASAPVDSGDYRDRLAIEVKEAKYRNVILVKGSDWKTMLIESKTGNLARALKQVR